jgi:hypothetical protein
VQGCGQTACRRLIPYHLILMQAVNSLVEIRYDIAKPEGQTIKGLDGVKNENYSPISLKQKVVEPHQTAVDGYRPLL